MKILVACVDMVPPNIKRQPWYYMDSIAKVLVDRGHDVWILTDKAAQWQQDMKIIVLENFRFFPQGVDDRVRCIIEKGCFDVVIWSTGLTDFFLKKQIDVLRIPVISVVTSPRYSLRELVSFKSNLFLDGKFIKHFFLGPFMSSARIRKFLAIPNLRAVVFECQETLKRFLAKGTDNGKSIVIFPPIPADFIHSLDKSAHLKTDTSAKTYLRILYFGPPINLRGIDTLIHALGMVSKKIHNVKLNILSRIECPELLKHERKMYELIRKKKLNSHVNVISGLLKPLEIAEKIINSDVVCLPFKYIVSDVPVAVLETLATGTPLITTEIAGVSEFAQNGNCLIVPPRDYRTLANAIITVLRGDLKKVTQSSMDRFLNTHSLRNFGLSFENILRKTV